MHRSNRAGLAEPPPKLHPPMFAPDEAGLDRLEAVYDTAVRHLGFRRGAGKVRAGLAARIDAVHLRAGRVVVRWKSSQPTALEAAAFALANVEAGGLPGAVDHLVGVRPCTAGGKGVAR